MLVPLELVTVSAICAEAVSVPEVAVMVTVEVPGVAELLAAKLNKSVVAGGVVELAVTPLGNPVTDNVPMAADAVQVTVPLLP
jgi:hypothetical protein